MHGSIDAAMMPWMDAERHAWIHGGLHNKPWNKCRVHELHGSRLDDRTHPRRDRWMQASLEQWIEA